MTAPIMLGVYCRVCGAGRIERPWNETDGYRCAACGAINWPPLMRHDERFPPEKNLNAGAISLQRIWDATHRGSAEQ